MEEIYRDIDELLEFLQADAGLPPEYDLRGGQYNLRQWNLHQIRGEMSVEIDGHLYKVRFCGTNHSLTPEGKRSEAELDLVREFSSGINEGDTLFTEQGSLLNGETNTYKCEMQKWLEKVPGQHSRLDLLYTYGLFHEMDYAAQLAAEKGAKVRNMDLINNPEAIPELVELVGEEGAIAHTKAFLDTAFYGPLNHFVAHALRPQMGGLLTYEVALVAKNTAAETGDILWNGKRDDYMFSVLMRELPEEGTAHLVAHSAHIAGMLWGLNQVGEVKDFYVELRENSAEAKKSNYRDYDKSPMLLSIPEEFIG